MKLLVTWGSKHGTADIGRIIGDVCTAHGHDVTSLPAEKVRDVRQFDACIIGAALHANRWPHSVRWFVERHIGELRKRPVWMFSSGPLDN
jgi:menaquinone-dependent protoporphyrinogen oxidase